MYCFVEQCERTANVVIRRVNYPAQIVLAIGAKKFLNSVRTHALHDRLVLVSKFPSTGKQAGQELRDYGEIETDMSTKTRGHEPTVPPSHKP